MKKKALVIKMSKILGAKVDSTVYDEFKSLDGEVSTNLRAAIENYIKQSKEPQLTTVNLKENNNEAIVLRDGEKDVLITKYQYIFKDIDELIENGNAWVEELESRGFGSMQSTVEYIVELSNIIKKIINFQLQSYGIHPSEDQGDTDEEQDDEQGPDENNTNDGGIWEKL